MAVTSALRARRPLGAAVLSAVVALLLGACGGGSGSDGPRQPPTNQPPTASFTLSVDDGFAPLTVSVDAGQSRDPDGTISSYQWRFHDDAAATGPSASHTYQDTGTFSVRLEVTDDEGHSATAVRSVRVRGATVSGTIRIAAGSAVDSDVNDRLTNPVGNNTFATAQAVAAPLRLGGFVNIPGSGADDGNFTRNGDSDDFYFVTLSGDEQILLSLGDPSADLDLELYSDSSPPELLDASVSGDASEDLTAPGPGSYFVRVLAVAGASNYVLGIEPRDLSEASLLRPVRSAKRLTDPFVTGELLMTDVPAGNGARRSADFGRFGLSARDGRLHLRPLSGSLSATGPGRPRRLLDLADVRAAPGAVLSPQQRQRYRTLKAVRQLHRDAPDAGAEVNVLRQPMRQPDDEFYPMQWHYGAIDLEQAWDLTTGAEPGNPEVVVAVVDTGVLLSHPDLAGRLLRDGDGAVVGFDFIQDSARANDGDGIDGNPDDPGDDAGGRGRGSFHGTHVAGTVAADSDNGTGVAGVSWGARIMPMRALGIDGGTTFDVMQAVRFAAGLPNVSGTVPPVRADIINLSLGSDFYSEAEQRTLNEVRAEGVFLVASAGNEAARVPNYPAAYDGVISVSATTRAGALAGYSNFGPFVDVAAPGGDGADPVLSTLGEGGDGDVEFGAGFLAGTSMAAPHVSGVIALMKALNPALTPAQFDALLQSDALTDDAGPAGRDDHFGWGVINANKAVQAAIGSAGALGAVLSVSTGTLNYQSFTRELDFSVSNLGSAPVAVHIEFEAPWLTVAAVDVDADGLGVYRATVDRTGLSDGLHQTGIRVEPDDPSVSARRITAALMVTRTDVDADAGQHYVILVSPDDSNALVAEIVNAVDGEYAFTLSDVPPGDYRLFAGTDLDNDDFICDGGEACGAYPDLSSPELVRVDGRELPELTGQSFSSEFRTTATTTAGAGQSGPAPVATADPSRRGGLAIPGKPEPAGGSGAAGFTSGARP